MFFFFFFFFFANRYRILECNWKCISYSWFRRFYVLKVHFWKLWPKVCTNPNPGILAKTS
ncbi:hypothetical protein HanHA89_Chr11g0409801 [Helianthus annuus]|nr:hypothetical protein HanHA89_Chr11g0409801 [Helianthus annuus]